MLEDWAYVLYRALANGRRQLPVWLHHYNHPPMEASLTFHLPLASLPR
jgi:hypothetical protein